LILPPLQGLENFRGRLTQGVARFTSLALGYYLLGFPPSSDFGATSQPFESAWIRANQRLRIFAVFALIESVSIGVFPWFPSPLHFAATRKLFCPERVL
jgi:hypothetical protein